MANGDAAAAAGMDTVPGTADRRDGYSEINKTRDYIAERTSAVTSVEKGGTGATTADGARTNLDAAKTVHGHLTWDIKLADGVTVLQTFLGNEQARLNAVSARANQGYIPGSGDLHTGGGRLNSIGSRNFTVSVNYASAYMDGDNWLGITPSALRFKQDVERFDYSLADALKLADCVATYRLKALVEEQGEDATGEVGVIAEWLIDAGFSEFVVRDAQGAVQSVAYERLAIVAFGGIAELAAKFDDLAARFDAFEEVAA